MVFVRVQEGQPSIQSDIFNSSRGNEASTPPRQRARDSGWTSSPQSCAAGREHGVVAIEESFILQRCICYAVYLETVSYSANRARSRRRLHSLLCATAMRRREKFAVFACAAQAAARDEYRQGKPKLLLCTPFRQSSRVRRRLYRWPTERTEDFLLHPKRRHARRKAALHRRRPARCRQNMDRDSLICLAKTRLRTPVVQGASRHGRQRWEASANRNSPSEVPTIPTHGCTAGRSGTFGGGF
jgi:hypothetical protein